MRHSTAAFLAILTALFISSNEAAKILMFVPALCKSELIFNNRIADTLSDAGHDVTLYLAQFLYESQLNRTSFMRKGKPFLVPADSGDMWHEMEEDMFDYMFTDYSFFSKAMVKQSKQMQALFLAGCDVQVRNTAALDELRAEHFDMAIGNGWDLCWVGLAEMIGIHTLVWPSSMPSHPLMTNTAGVPLATSFVPGLFTGYGDEMTLYERSATLVAELIFIPWVAWSVTPTTDLFRKRVSADFPDLVELLRTRTELHLINNIEMLDFAQPHFAHYVHIGGLGYKPGEPLDAEWSSVYDKAASGVIYVSFGSVASAKSMPDGWKATIVAAATAMPQYTFIWKYDSNDIYDKFSVPANVLVSKWLPQRDLLSDSRTLAFVTHGGQTSVLDAVLAGTPMIVVPLGGDQFYNAAVVCKRHKVALCIGSKADMNSRPQVLIDALTELVQQPSYRSNARRLRALLLGRPDKPERMLTEWIDFLALFKQLHVLKAPSRHMNLVQKMSYDVLFLLMLILHVIVFGVVMLVRKCCMRKVDNKAKKD